MPEPTTKIRTFTLKEVFELEKPYLGRAVILLTKDEWQRFFPRVRVKVTRKVPKAGATLYLTPWPDGAVAIPDCPRGQVPMFWRGAYTCVAPPTRGGEPTPELIKKCGFDLPDPERIVIYPAGSIRPRRRLKCNNAACATGTCQLTILVNGVPVAVSLSTVLTGRVRIFGFNCDCA